MALLEIIRRSGRMADFIQNPERFMEQTVAILRGCKAEMIVDGIRYQKIAGEEYSVMEIFGKEELLAHFDSNAVPVEHSVYDHVVIDSMGVEGRFAHALDSDPDVKLFFELPGNFKIDTPLGGYNPDWAVLLSKDGIERLYFVLGTKGTMREIGRRIEGNIKIECGKRHFEALGTVSYEVTDDWKRVKLRT